MFTVFLLRRLYCLFLMSITATLLPIAHLHYGDYCLIFISLGPDNLNKIGIFRGEGGFKWNFHLSYGVQRGDIFHISEFLLGDRVPLRLVPK